MFFFNTPPSSGQAPKQRFGVTQRLFLIHNLRERFPLLGIAKKLFYLCAKTFSIARSQKRERELLRS